MATIHGKAGENAFLIGLEKQQNVLFAIVLVCCLLFLVAGTLWGLSFSRHWPTQWISVIGILLLSGLVVGLNKKIDRKLETRLRAARAWRRGAEGERVIADVLESELPDGYHVFNDVRFPERTANIDHLVVGPSGVFVLNTKNWRGTVGWAEDGKTLLWNGEPEKKNSANAALSDALDVRDKLRTLLNRQVFVRAVLVFPLAKVLPKLDTPVELQQDDYLIDHRLKYIDRRTALSEKDIQEIVGALTALFRKDI